MLHLFKGRRSGGVCVWAVLVMLAAAGAASAGEVIIGELTPGGIKTQCRLLDTRHIGGEGLGPKVSNILVEAASSELDDIAWTGTDKIYNLQGGQPGCRVPANATAVQLNLTVYAPSGSGFARLYPEGQVEPLSTALSYITAQQDEATGLSVALGSGSRMRLKSLGASAHFIVELAGWVTPALSTSAGEITQIDHAVPEGQGYGFYDLTLNTGAVIRCQDPFIAEEECEFLEAGDLLFALGHPEVSGGSIRFLAHAIDVN